MKVAGKIVRSINIQKEIWEQLQKLAKENNRSASNMIETLILKEIQNESK